MFAGTEQFSRVEADAASLKPARSRWKHTVLGEATAMYSSNQIDLTVRGHASEMIGVQGPVYDSEEVPELLRCLPLNTNYSLTISIVSALGSGTPLPLTIDVTKLEMITVPAGSFECFRVDLNGLHQTYWISTDAHRHLVKLEASRAETELVAIENANSNEPVRYWNKVAGITMTAPPGWYFFEADPDDLLARVYALDPEATAHTFVVARARQSLLPDWRDSLHAWAEHEITEGSPMMRDVYARKDSWRTQMLAGAPGQSVLADFIEGTEKKMLYQVVAFVGPEVIEFTSHIPAADEDSMLPKMEEIVKSVKRF